MESPSPLKSPVRAPIFESPVKSLSQKRGREGVEDFGEVLTFAEHASDLESIK